jgi:7-keto-8-aminopelargonate synthetase-like enzyme
MKKLLTLLSLVLLSHSANAWFFFVPIPNLAKHPELQKIIDAYEKSSETKAVAFVAEDKAFGSKQWIWGHKSGVMTQDEANSIAMRTCSNELARMKAMLAGGQPIYDFGQKRCELYKFSNETVSLPQSTQTETVSTEQPKVEESKTAKKLRELDSLLKQQLITQEEYDKKRKEILYSF